MKDKTGHLNLKPEGGDLISKTFLMDCMEGLKVYPDKHFDLAVVDPPYGIKASEMKMGKGKNQQWSTGKKWDNKTPNSKYFAELFRVSKNQIIWGGNYFDLPKTGGFIFWDKMRDKEVSFADGELAWTNFLTVLRKAPVRYDGFIGRDKERIHPTQKPVALYDWIFKSFASQSHRCGHKHTEEYNHLCDVCKHPFKVLDTHLGSGSSRISAHKYGLSFVGFEIDEEYFFAQEQRFKTYLSQPTLFDLPRAVGVLNSNAPTLNFEQGTEL
jgi:site-specific DNA-methyltransferase (adenine-specific)